MRIRKRGLSTDYPKIMVWLQYGTLAIQFSKGADGVVIESGRTDLREGSKVSMVNFVEFDGELVLSNR